MSRSHHPTVHVVTVIGTLDDAAAARLLRLSQARLHLLDAGHAALGHVVVDMSRCTRALASAVAILDQARAEATRRRVGFHLAGAAPIMAASPPRVRHLLGRWSGFPNLETALAILDRAGTDGTSGGSPAPRPGDVQQGMRQ